jgi:hypothetical protein
VWQVLTEAEHISAWFGDATEIDPRRVHPQPGRGGTRLRVVETGFAGLQVSDEDTRAAVKENTEGWINELGELREYAERPAA